VNALVTGAGGFLGLYIVEQLVARGDRVRALCRGDATALNALGVEVVRGDLRDAQAIASACRGVDAVFHVAGVEGIAGPWKHYYENNTLATRNVIAGCAAGGVGRLVYTSSPSVTFDGRSQENVDESAPYPKRWLCHYSHSKAVAEQSVLAASGREGLLTCALRPHLIWGPRDRHLVPHVWSLARRGRLCRVGNGKNLIDTVFVENAATAHLLAADSLKPGSPTAGNAYFISQGEPVNCWAWINELLAIAGLPPVRRSLPPLVAWTFGLFCESAYGLFHLDGQPPMSRFLARQMTASHYFNIARARAHFGYQPKISMAEGMRRLAASPLLPGRDDGRHR
jgi:2-alkyl-3-oxoalkanoate reductase